MTNFEQKYSSYLNFFDISLSNLFEKVEKNSKSIITDSVIYSLKNGGKRIRPILFLATCDILGVDYLCYENLALSIELIHTYSLVHDDLPCMDNDDYRRGQLSTHKKFGEAFGVLSGDALLNLAFETALDYRNIDQNYLNAIKLLSAYAGYSGMIFGQTLDILAETNLERSKDNLYAIYLNKTAKLLTAPLLMASLLTGKKYYNELEEIGINLGYLFQIQDDILDEISDIKTLGKTPKKDQAKNKLTAVSIFGLENAKKLANEHYLLIINALGKIPNSEFLRQFVDKIYNRNF